jgi:hypothetical protein
MVEQGHGAIGLFDFFDGGFFLETKHFVGIVSFWLGEVVLLEKLLLCFGLALVLLEELLECGVGVVSFLRFKVRSLGRPISHLDSPGRVEQPALEGQEGICEIE